MDNDNKHIDIIGLLPKYFSNEATTEERKIVDNWLLINENSRKEFSDFEKLWNLTSSAPEGDDIDIETEWKILEKSIEPKVRRLNFVRMFEIAASIAFVIVISYIGYKISDLKTEKAPVASLSTSSLPDGTIVSLNAGSKIIYRKGFGTIHRNIILKGEAFFEVQKNSDIPFIIKANETSIVVTGTKFNIKAYKDTPEVKVTVTEGTVKFFETDQPLKETILNAGESGSYDRDLKAVTKQPLENLNDIAWKTLIMDFENTLLQEVADILQNTYHYKIILAPRIQKCPITVHFENRNLDYILELLKSSLDLSVQKENKKIYITGKGC